MARIFWEIEDIFSFCPDSCFDAFSVKIKEGIFCYMINDSEDPLEDRKQGLLMKRWHLRTRMRTELILWDIKQYQPMKSHKSEKI